MNNATYTTAVEAALECAAITCGCECAEAEEKNS